MADYTGSKAVWGGPNSEYRYSLFREWFGGRGKVVFILLNPSTADEKTDDPTVRRCMRRAMADGFGCAEIVNVFAIRGTNPKVIKEVDDPIGPENDRAIMDAVRNAGMVICAWGNHGGYNGRGGEVIEMISYFWAKVKVFGWTKSGEPKHPLYLSNDCKLEDFDITV